MKNASSNILVLSTIAALATAPSGQPESDIAIPAEKPGITQDVPSLGKKEQENWQRLREERKIARQQILTDIKANAKAEIKEIQQDRNQQKSNNNLNENKEAPLNKDNLLKKNQEPQGLGLGRIEKPRPFVPPLENPKPFEHTPISKYK